MTTTCWHPRTLASSTTRRGARTQFTNYTGTPRRADERSQPALWSLRLGDFNLLVSPQVTDKSKMLYRRKISTASRGAGAVPDLRQGPYVVVADGRCTGSSTDTPPASTYPYSQSSMFQSTSTDGFEINYVRNSVKVVIDAYEGSADFYVIDPKDPIIKAYQATFPTLFKPIDAMPAGLRDHLRVPATCLTSRSRCTPRTTSPTPRSSSPARTYGTFRPRRPRPIAGHGPLRAVLRAVPACRARRTPSSC